RVCVSFSTFLPFPLIAQLNRRRLVFPRKFRHKEQRRAKHRERNADREHLGSASTHGPGAKIVKGFVFFHCGNRRSLVLTVLGSARFHGDRAQRQRERILVWLSPERAGLGGHFELRRMVEQHATSRDRKIERWQRQPGSALLRPRRVPAQINQLHGEDRSIVTGARFFERQQHAAI